MSEIRVNQIQANEDSVSFIGITTFSGTGALGLPGGGSLKRPEVPKEGQVRYINGDVKKGLEYYNGTEWVTVGSGIVTSNLILNLDAGNTLSYPGSGTTWTNLSGYDNASLNNGPTYSSSNGGSIVFDNVNDSFTGNFSCNKTYYSVDFWCYPTERTDFNWAIGFNSFWGDFGFHTTSSGGVYVGTSTGSRITPWRNDVFVLNTWQNFTWTFDNGAGKFYKNGVLEASASLSLSASASFTSYGGGGSGVTNNCTGRLATFKVYSGKALTASEIEQNFNATRSRFGI